MDEPKLVVEGDAAAQQAGTEQEALVGCSVGRP
jgi:hypothetical protein